MFGANTWCIDTETNSFTPDRFHCVSAGQDKDNVFSTTDYSSMRRFFSNSETLIGHNIQRADVPWIERILGVPLEDKRIIDTLPLSWALFPDLDKHGLYDWGTRLNIPKVEILDWVSLPPEKYIERCEQDVRINLGVWERILDKLSRLYTSPNDLNRYIDYLSFKMYSARLAEQNKWKVDLRHIHESLINLHTERDKRIEELARAMPRVPVMGSRSVPKRAYNKAGELTKLGKGWFEQVEALGLPSDTQEISLVKGYEDPNPGSPHQVKAWLDSLGWIPETFKEVKDKDGVKKQISQINKEKQKGGGVCESIQKLFDKEPALQSLDNLSILNHRIPILSGFVSNSDGGYLKAKIAGLTNTLRFKHTEVVNLPKIGLPFAEAIRGSLICEEDEILVGADMSALEDVLKRHYIYPYDPKYVEEMDTEGFDPHLDIAFLAKMISAEDVEAYKQGNKSKKSIRDIAKNINYASQYGAYPPKLAQTGGISLKQAKALHEIYWKRNWSVKAVSEDQIVKEITNELWLFNPVSRFWYSLRSRKDIFSTLVQGTASYVFDKWLAYTLEETGDLIGQYHDEWIMRTKEGNEDHIKEIAYKALERLNQEIKLNRNLNIGVQYGKRYSSIH